jgi:hypothetical protein
MEGEIQSLPLSDHDLALCCYCMCDYGNRMSSLCWNMWVRKKMNLGYLFSLLLFCLSSIDLSNKEDTNSMEQNPF